MKKARNSREIAEEIERTRSQMTDNMNAIENKLQPRHMMDQAVSAMRGMASSDSGVARMARDNPVPLALLGIGAGWLAYSALRSNWSPRTAGAPAYSVAGEEFYEEPAPYSGGAGYGASLDYGSEYEAASSESYGPRASESGRAESARAALHETRAKGRQKLGEMRQRAGRYGKDLQSRAGYWARDARRQASGLAHRTSEIYRETPLAVGAAALVVGAAIGAGLTLMSRRSVVDKERAEEWGDRARMAGADAIARASELGREAMEEGAEELAETRERMKDISGEKPDRTMH